MVLDDREYLSPPDNEAEKVLKCYLCKDWISEGDKYYLISGLEYCEDCIEEKSRTLWHGRLNIRLLIVTKI